MEHTDVVATLKFLKWQPLYDSEKPFQIFINIPNHAKDRRTTNLVYEDIQIPVQDVRGSEADFTLDTNGFAYVHHKTDAQNFSTREVVDKIYLPEIEALLQRELEELRKNAPEVEGSIIDLNDLTTWLRPAMHVHIDQSPSAVLRRIQLQLEEDADFLLQGRIRIVNVWRPLINSVQDWPLAVCDGRTVDPADLVEADHIRRQYTGANYYLQHNPRQRFYYMSNQTRSDVLIFKNFDSKSDVPAKFAPHASFLHPNVPIDAVPRESIEVRALVFTYPKHVAPPPASGGTSQ